MESPGMATDNFLREVGLNEKEVEIYLYLAKNGPQKALSIARNLHIHKMQVYRYLDAMQKKGVVLLTFTAPKKFAASPIEKLVKARILSLKEELLNIEKNTKKIVSYSGFCFPTQIQLSTFSIVQGREKVQGLVNELLKRATNEICLVYKEEDLGKLIMATASDYCRRPKTEFSSRYIIQVKTKTGSKPTAPSFKALIAAGCQSHMIAADDKLPSLAIADDKEAVLFVEESSMTVLWTNNALIMRAIKGFFEKLWTDTAEMLPSLQEGRVITE